MLHPPLEVYSGHPSLRLPLEASVSLPSLLQPEACSEEVSRAPKPAAGAAPLTFTNIAGGGFGQPAAAQGTGTAVAPYQPTTVMEPPKEEGKPDPPNQTPHSFQSICCMPQYANYSFEVSLHVRLTPRAAYH